MNNLTIDNIIENLFYVLPIIRKKLLKLDPAEISSDFSLSRLHVGVMGIIREENTLPISEIAKKLLIPKPQMSLLINQLVKAGMVGRHPNRNDRRVSDITLTPQGQSTLNHCEELLKNNIRENLSDLNEHDLEELSISLQKLKDIGKKWGIPKNVPEVSLQASTPPEINS